MFSFDLPPLKPTNRKTVRAAAHELRSRPERFHCVYFLFDGADLIYVGYSSWLCKRLSQHRLAGVPFTRVGFIEYDNELAATEYELQCILKLKPRLNKAKQLWKRSRWQKGCRGGQQADGGPPRIFDPRSEATRG